MLGLRLMAKKGLDAYEDVEILDPRFGHLP